MEWRPVAEDEYRQYLGAIERSFGYTPDDDFFEAARPCIEFDRTLVAVDDRGDFAANGGNFTFELAVPGGSLPVSGLTAIGVRATDRRQGLLTEMMDRLLAESAERGEAASVLIASEATIYGRYGYGKSSFIHRYVADPRLIEMRVPPGQGQLREVSADDLRKVGPELWDRYWRQTPGEVSRTPGLWEAWLNDPEKSEKGEIFHVIHEDPDGVIDGWAAYRRKGSWGPTGPDGVLDCEWAIATNPETHLALWQHLLAADLVAQVRLWGGPDEPTLWTLDNSRRLRTEYISDMQWTRMLDVSRCLAARTYSADGAVVLGVTDEFRPANAGGYRLTVDGSTVRAERTDDQPDLQLGIGELGSIWAGAISPTVLARAGRISPADPAVVATLAAMCRVDPAPLCVLDY